MNVEGQSKQSVLMIELAGLVVSALVLLFVAYCMRLGLGLLTHDALRPGLGLLVFGLLFYIGVTFLAAGTHQKPDDPVSLLANVGFAAAFLCLGWLFWTPQVTLSRLGLALAFSALVHGGAYGFALLRGRSIRTLLRHRAVIQDAFVPRFFLPRSPAYLAIPIGAVLGAILGAALATEPATVVRHALAGVFAAIAAGEMLRLGTGFSMLARSLTATHEEARVSVRAAAGPRRPELLVYAPERSPSHAELLALAACIAADLRRVFLVTQLQHMAIFGMSWLALWQLAFPSLSVLATSSGLLTAALFATLVPYGLGQHGANKRLLARAPRGASAFAPPKA